MNEDDFRASLRDAIDFSTPPPPMSPTRAVATGRRAARRRTVAACGAAGAVTAVVAAVAVAVAGGGSGSAAPQQVGAPSVLPSAAGTPAAGRTGKEVWPTQPNGQPQEDRTARAGHKFDQGEQLLADLLTLVPAGYTAPDTPGTDRIAPSRMAQAQYEQKVGGKDAWSYLASAYVAKDGKVGQLLVTVYEPGLQAPSGDMCVVARAFWSEAAGCTLVTTPAGLTVGVATGAGADNYDGWAGYRYADGTVVLVAQAKGAGNGPGASAPKLTALPLSQDALAAAVTDTRFHLRAS